MDVTKLTILECKNELDKGTFTCEELTKEFCKKVENDQYNTFITKTTDLAIAQAKQCDKDRQNGINKKMSGVVMSIKDAFCTKDIKTTCGSKMLHNFIPQYESTTTQRLLDAGSIIIGKTNMDEFSMGSSNTTSYFGPVINPLKDKTRPNENLVPGGSSGGSAVSVLADYCQGSIGGDTGGSVKQPASFCGIVGARPTYGRCSRYGLIAYSSSLDQPSVFAKDVKDAAYILETISGHDTKDSTMHNAPAMDILSKINSINVKDLTIGIPVNCRSSSTMSSINSTWDKVASYLSQSGAKIKEINIDYMEIGVEVYYTITTSEAFSNLARFDGVKYGYRTNSEIHNINDLYTKTRSEGFGSEVKRRLLLGAHVLSAENYENMFLRAAKIRRKISDGFKKAFTEVDVLLTPTTPNVSFGLNDILDPVQMYFNDVMTIPPNLAGLGGISVPSGTDPNTGLPIGMQIIPNMYDELKMFVVAQHIENGFKNNAI